jgi:hypothetical protein
MVAALSANWIDEHEASDGYRLGLSPYAPIAKGSAAVMSHKFEVRLM